MTLVSLRQPLPAHTHINLAVAKEAAHAYAWEYDIAIAVQRSTEWGNPPCISVASESVTCNLHKYLLARTLS